MFVRKGDVNNFPPEPEGVTVARGVLNAFILSAFFWGAVGFSIFLLTK